MKQNYKPVLDNIPIIRDFMEQQLDSRGISSKKVMQICLAVEEIVTNIIYHGQQDPQTDIELSIVETPKAITVTITDQGIPFNPLEADIPEQSTSLETAKPGGLGIFFVKQVIDRIDYKRVGNSNHLYLIKNK